MLSQVALTFATAVIEPPKWKSARPLLRCARLTTLDYFGCDGRPWRPEDGGPPKGRGKELVGRAGRFLAAARKNGKGGLILVENITLPTEYLQVMDRHLPEVLSYEAEHLIYYYYGKNVEDPDRAMSIVAEHLKARQAPGAGRGPGIPG